MNLTETVKTYIRTRHDMDLVGVCAAAALDGEPRFHRPADLLPGAKSVIVFGRGFSDGAVQSMFRALEDAQLAAQSSYAAYCDELAPNFLLIGDSFNICCWLEETCGALAVPCPFNVQQSMVWDSSPKKFFADPYGQGMPLDIGKAALAAGLGEYGWSGRFLTPEYGPRQMLTAIVTTLELEPDAPYDGPALCDPEKCGVCARVCPTKAISDVQGGETRVVSAGEKRQTIGCVNANACAVAALAYRKEFQGRVPVPDLILNDDPTDEELRAAWEKKPVAQLSIEHYPRYFCEKCAVYCPAGHWKERFADTGFTRFDPEKGEKA